MAMNTGIEWTDCTWNPSVGCTPVSPGCLNCYAARMARRLEGMGVDEYLPRIDEWAMPRPGEGAAELENRVGNPPPPHVIRIAEVKAERAVFTGEVRTVPHRLDAPLHWKKPRRVFVNSMSDLFHEDVPFDFIDRVFAVMALCPQHTFQILTKRPERMAEYLDTPQFNGRSRRHDNLVLGWSREILDTSNGKPRVPQSVLGRLPKAFPGWPLPNVWLGTSVENQATADARIPQLLRCPAAVRFLSVEPMLGPIDLRMEHEYLTDVMDAEGGRDPRYQGRYPFPGAPIAARTRRRHVIDWVIAGGESGPKARPCDVAWIRSIVQQCRSAGVPCFVKQLGTHVMCSPADAEAWFDAVGVGLDLACAADWAERVDDGVRMRLVGKGGDPAEWPEDLRVQEFPGAGGADPHAAHPPAPSRREGEPEKTVSDRRDS